jgi:FeS assembly SUF system protein
MSGLLSRFKSWGQKSVANESDASEATDIITETTGKANGTGSENPMIATDEKRATDQLETVGNALLASEENEAVILSPIEVSLLQGEIIEQLRTIYDPEIPVNIYELGLIYDIGVTPQGAVDIKMTLTSPGCPVAGTLPPEVQDKAAGIPGVTEAKVDVVWDPPWNMDMMSDEAKLELGLF